MTLNQNNHLVEDLSSNHLHRTEIPNILFLLKLTPVQLSVYLTLKRIAGDRGCCIKSVKNIVKEANVNERSFKEAKKFLSQVHPFLGKPLIIITTRKKPNKDCDTDLIQIVDIWDKNYEYFYNLKKNNTNKNVENPKIQKSLGGCKNAGGVGAKMHPYQDLKEEEIYHQSNLYKSNDPEADPEPDRLIDDFFSKKEEEKQNILEGSTCWMTESELAECVKAKGSLQKVKETIQQVESWPGRKNEIQDWPTTIKNWKTKSNAKVRTANNEEAGHLIEKKYGNAKGWHARVYTDRRKDQKGILFETDVGMAEPIFISFGDMQFEQKVTSVLISKNLIKKGNKAS